MKSMDKISTGIAYGTSAGSAGYWFLQLLDKVTPSQWAAIGVLGIRTGGRVLAVNSQTRTLTLDREITLPSSG
nr:host specificity protein J [Escherichia coli]